jgi:NADPH:quinone reductase-like Zn-dependent oxidoreductase
MKAFCLNEHSSPLALDLRDRPTPEPQEGEILIRVHAAGVTPTELGWEPTTQRQDGSARHGAVPGHEFSGVVAALGAGVGGVEVGQAVYGMNDWYAEGATAEFCVTRAEWVAAKPATFTPEQAAAVPIGALTAWQGLYERAKLRAGERVLIHGGSGAVGVFAVQLARRAGARIWTTAAARHAEFLKQLGAGEVIDYRTERFEDRAGQVDVVFDAVGGETLRRSWALLAPGGRMVTIASASEGGQDERTKAAFFIVEARQSQLSEIAGLLDAGELRVVVDGIVPFADASAAYLSRIKRDTGRGKVVIRVVG